MAFSLSRLSLLRGCRASSLSAPLLQANVALRSARLPLCTVADEDSRQFPKFFGAEGLKDGQGWRIARYNKGTKHTEAHLKRKRQGWVRQQWHPEKPRHPHALEPKPHRGPPPKEPLEWEDPEAATQEAMMQFIDPYEVDPDLGAPGRRWHAAEMRLKSNEDLQKLWVVLMRERNMLATTLMMHRKRGTQMPYFERVRNTKKSMAMIKVVLGERQREKAERDARLAAERYQATALRTLDLPNSSLWPLWIPGSDREMPLAAHLTFNVVLRTTDGTKPKVQPPIEALELKLTHNGEEVREGKLKYSIVRRPPAAKRPSEITYACHVTLAGDTFDSRDRKFLMSDTELGPPLDAQLSATLYGEAVGAAPVPVLLLPSKKMVRKVQMRLINEQMRAELKERYAFEDDV